MKRDRFEIDESMDGSFNSLLGDNNDFSSDTFKNVKLPNNKSKAGRPIEIFDERFKVNKPKKISASLESKLKNLQNYMGEFQDFSGRITFEKQIDALVESYIKQNLGVKKEDLLRKQIAEDFEKL